MEERFGDVARRASKLLYLVPSVLVQEGFKTDILADTIDQFKDDIPSPHLIESEIDNWRCTYLNLPKDKVPTTIAGAIKEIDAVNFPNVFVMLKLVATFPITPCECERSFSTMRRLKSWLRSSMDTERLGALALMNAHYNHEVSYTRASDLFFQLFPRKLEKTNLVF